MSLQRCGALLLFLLRALGTEHKAEQSAVILQSVTLDHLLGEIDEEMKPVLHFPFFSNYSFSGSDESTAAWHHN